MSLNSAYIDAAENFQGKKTKALQSDNGGEYTSNQFMVFLKENGIKHRLTVPYNTWQNIKHILRYAQRTKYLTLNYEKKASQILTYTDAD